ncbi:MAG: bifunctional DNA primase/polymerase [Pseudonocardia sp.]|nr:bifunctional DNA primase/polymerase [Pseudonocardia sp.]
MRTLLAAGWAPIPVEPGTKKPLLRDVTGRAGADLTFGQWQQLTLPAGVSLGVRMPAGVVGVDVDAYGDKRGKQTLAEAERRWGPLPAGPWSSARADGVSGISFYRVPAGTELAGVVSFPELGLADVELIQRHHRLAVVAPSIHSTLGLPYSWRGTAGPSEPPRVTELPELPQAWLNGLRRAVGIAGRDAHAGEVRTFVAGLPDGPACPAVRDALDAFTAVPGSRHDSVRDAQQRVVRLGEQGHHGAAEALDELRASFENSLAGERDAESEFDAMLPGAVGPVLDRPTPQSSRRCCPAHLDAQAWAQLGVNVGDYVVVRPPSAQAAGDTTGPVTPRPWTLADAIGTEPFDPDNGETDHALAEAVALRLYPALRFNVDTGSWLVRHGEVWRDRKDDTAVRTWPLTKLIPLMPTGDPMKPAKGERPTREQRQATRLARFRTSGPASAIGARLRALVNDHHPMCITGDELDADPGVLWAGGVPWDLRRSGEVPTPAALDPGTPHLHTAACAPDPTVATPAWDRFVATVLPDEQLRAWAMRVLAVSLTGHSDAVLPILFGPERSGKTFLVASIMRLLGTYGHAGDTSLLGAELAPSVVAELKGRRAVFVDEGPRKGHLATERLKQLTGGGQLSGARKYRDPISFSPTHTLLMTTNEEPHLGDPALRARMRVIPAEAPESAVRPAVQAVLSMWGAEAPGILAALMRSAAMYLADLDSVAKDRAGDAATFDGRTEAELAGDQDPIGQWIDQRMTRLDDSVKGTPAAELLDTYCAWLSGQPRLHGPAGRPSYPTPHAFGRRLSSLGVSRVKTNKCWLWALTQAPGRPWPSMPR